MHRSELSVNPFASQCTTAAHFHKNSIPENRTCHQDKRGSLPRLLAIARRSSLLQLADLRLFRSCQRKGLFSNWTSDRCVVVCPRDDAECGQSTDGCYTTESKTTTTAARTATKATASRSTATESRTHAVY